MTQLEKKIVEIVQRSRAASRRLLSLSTRQKNEALARMAELLQQRKEKIQSQNLKDLEAGRKKGLSPAMLDRLALSDKVFDSIVEGIHQVIALTDPVGSVTSLVKRPNGLQVGRMNVPLGVVCMIYESRPNVTVDAAVLCLKAGNCAVLRGGSEAIYSNLALAEVLRDALWESGIDQDAIQVIPVTEREAVQVLLQQEAFIDLVIPRGGEGLIRFVSENSRIPVLKHYKGVCHIYVDALADLDKATPIIINAKVQRPGVCNALEGLLIHESIAESYVPVVMKALTDAGVTVVGCERARKIDSSVVPAEDSDWGTEFLDLKLCLKIVSDYEEAKEYINTHGSQHTEVILTEDYTLARKFIQEIDASAVMVNASTRFNDGGQLGLGTEIGISTSKLHAYGPMGLEELTSRKFIVFGEGQIRD